MLPRWRRSWKSSVLRRITAASKGSATLQASTASSDGLLRSSGTSTTCRKQGVGGRFPRFIQSDERRDAETSNRRRTVVCCPSGLGLALLLGWRLGRDCRTCTSGTSTSGEAAAMLAGSAEYGTVEVVKRDACRTCSW